MVLQGWDLNSTCITITTPWLLSRGWGQMWLQYPTFHTKMVCFWIDSRFSQHLNPSNFSLYIWWMVGEGGDCCVGSKMVTTTCFSVTGGVKVGLALVHFSHQDWVSLDWFGQFTASQPFQCLIVSMMNGFARLRFEFNMYNNHYTLAFESWVGTNVAPVPYFSHQDGVFLDWFKIFTASQPFQLLIVHMMNGWRRWRLLCGL